MKILACAFWLLACGDHGSGGGDVDADDPITARCGDGTHFELTGAFEVESTSFGFITVDKKVAGVAGAVNGQVFTFTVRGLADFDAVGAHDVATDNVAFLRSPLGTSCEEPSPDCVGFFAQAGTIDVLAVAPRFQATFALRELHERPTSGGPPGPAISGEISGCVDGPRP